jgi:YbgC/YbaW family acyl-CoA thioester hydrolase
MNDTPQPIIYFDTINVRISDLDPYDHVNSAIYLDYIITSRWRFAELEMKASPASLVKKGLGFYLVNSNMNYRKSIQGSASIFVESWVSDIQNSKLFVDYTIKNEESLASEGKLTFIIMDLATMKPQSLPEWAEYLFWK